MSSQLLAMLTAERAPDVQQKIAAAQFFNLLKTGGTTPVDVKARNAVRAMGPTNTFAQKPATIKAPEAKPVKTAGVKSELRLLRQAAHDYYGAATAPELGRWAALKARIKARSFRSQQPLDKFHRDVAKHPDAGYQNAVQNVLRADAAMGGGAKKVQEIAGLARHARENPLHGVPALLKSRALTGRSVEENLGFVADKISQRRQASKRLKINSAVLPVAGAVAGAGTLALVMRRRAAQRAAQSENQPATTP